MRQKEIAEQEAIEAENHKLYTPTEDQQEEEATNLVNTEKASPLQIQKELNTFKFKSDVIMATQFTLLALTASSMVSLCTLPYQILFLLQCLFFTMSQKKTYMKARQLLGRGVLVAVVAEIVV